MTQIKRVVTGGVDSHAESHAAVALDEQGRLLGGEAFPVSAAGYQQLLGWLESFGELGLVGVESTGSYAAGLARFLATAGVRVVEVNQPHPHSRRRRGKSDPLDAEAAARTALTGEGTAVPKQTDGIVESIRQLRVAYEGAVKAHTAALNQLHSLSVTAPEELRAQLRAASGPARKVSLCLALRADPGRLDQPAQAAKLVLRSVARRARMLEQETGALNQQLSRLVAAAAPRTVSLLGVSTHNGGQLLVSAGENIERLHNEAAFAHLCGASPIPASSGRTVRHRLNPGGDRQANRALHMVAVCRLRHCQRSRAYAERRTAEGLSKPEIIRCLKRYIARELYHTLRADLAALTPATSLASSHEQPQPGPTGSTPRPRRRALQPARPQIIAGSQIPEHPCQPSGNGQPSHPKGGSQSRARSA
jgi:transposase